MIDRRTWILPLVAVAVAFGLWWITRTDPAGARAPEAPEAPVAEAATDRSTVREAAATEAEVRVAQEVQTAAEPDDPPSYKAALGGLRGRLVWQGSKEPVPGVEIQCLEAWLDTVVPSLEDVLGLAAEERAPVLFKGKGRTDKEGKFEIQGVHGTAFLLLGIGLRTDKAELRFVDRMPAKGETVDLGDVELGERGSVEGRVVDAAGKGIAGARVRVADLPGVVLQMGLSSFTPEGLVLVDIPGAGQMVLPFPAWVRKHDKDLPFGDTTTDEEGKFLVAGCRAGPSTVIASKDGLEGATRALRVRAGKTTDLGSVALKPGLSLRGRFVDGEDKPVTGLRVTAGTMMNMAPVALLAKPREADAEGRFLLTGLSRGKLMLAFQRGSGEPWEVRGPYRGDEDLTIKLPELTGGTVTVQDRQGQPVAEAEITLLAADEATLVPGFERRVRADKHLRKDAERPGSWQVVALPAGEYKVVARAKGFGIDQALLDLRAESKARTVVLSLPPAVTQRFEAVDDKGQGVAAARIYWYCQNGRSSTPAGPPRERRAALSVLPVLLGKTGADGVLQCGVLEEGASRFVCRHPGYAFAFSGEQRARGGTTIRFTLREGGHIEGVLSERGAPPSEVRTIMAEPSWELMQNFEGLLVPRFTLTRPDGSFAFRHLDPGRWRLEIAPSVGQARSVQEMIKLVEAASALRARTDAQVTAGTTVRVRLEAGSPAAAGDCSIAGTVRVNGKPGTGLRVASWAGPRQLAEVDENGAFVLDGLNEAEHYVRVERPSPEGILRQELWSGRVKTTKGQAAALHLTLVCGDVKVRLEDPGGQPLSGVMLVLQGQRRPSEARGGPGRQQAVTGEDGIAELSEVAEGSYQVGIEGGHDRTWVLERTVIEVNAGTSGRIWPLRAISPCEVRGALRLDLDGLTAEEREWASRQQPGWAMLESAEGGGFGNSWAELGEGTPRTFHFRGLAPGRYTVVAWSQMRWASAPIEVPASGLSGIECALKPDRDQLKRQMEAAKKKK